MHRTCTLAARCAALLLLFAACSKSDSVETPDRPEDPENPNTPETPDTPEQPDEEAVIRFALRVDGVSDSEAFDTVAAYLFDASGALYKTEELRPDSDRTVSLATRSDTEAYFLAGATVAAETGMSRSSFLQLSVGENLTHDHSAPEFFVGQASFASGVPSAVQFRRRTARIDLDTQDDPAIAVTAITLKNAPAATYPFLEHREASDRRLTYERHFAQPQRGQVSDLFRVYESETPVEVEITGSYNGVPIVIEAAFPTLDGNRVYTLVLRSAGSSIESSFVVAPWEEGDTVVGTPDTEHRILLDRDYSHFPTGVQVDYATNTIAIPASGGTMQLAFRASTQIEISATEGVTEQVHIGTPEVVPVEGGYVTSYPLTIEPQGRGRLGYEVLLHLKYALYKDHYDYVDLRIAASDYQIETVKLAGLEWMAFNARSRELEDQVYPLDGCTVETMYSTNWLACIGGLFQFGRLYMYTPWQGYNPSNNLGGQQSDVPWRNDTHMPCPEGYRVPSPQELNALLPSGTTIPGSYQTAAGERIQASLLTADSPITTPTNVTGTPRYVKLEAQDGRYLIIPLAGSKGDKSTTNNPNFGQRAVLWTNDNTGMPGGWAITHSITFANETATVETSRLQMEGFASLRCVKK